MVRYLSMMGFYGQYDYLKAAKSDTKMKWCFNSCSAKLL
jgi:hypothetical protein